VNERWVCKRCFADNESTSGACQRCGLVRGADATQADQQAWAAQATPVAPAQNQGWRALLRYWWVLLIVGVLVVGYLASARRGDTGEITSGGSLSIEDLQVGDCFSFSDEGDEISQVDAHPCTEAHSHELFHVATWTGSDGFPSVDQMDAFVFDECAPAFEQFVGEAYATSELYFDYFSPTSAGWDDGDRVFQCALYDPSDAALTSSMEDAAR
jgi:putative regulator of septum formation